MKSLVPLLFAGLLLQPSPDEGGDLERAAATPASTVAPAAPLPPGPAMLAPAPFSQAAAALRRGDCTTARSRLQQIAAAAATPLPGFYAHACEDIAAAEKQLQARAAAAGPFEDWRLYLLADSAAALGHRALATATLTRLAADHPSSPLHPRALLRAAQLAAEAGDLPQARAWIAKGERLPLPAEVRTTLDALDWELATRVGDGEGRKLAARRLLVHSPFEAARLQVAEIFRSTDGTLDWARFLSREEREVRARTLLELGVAAGALTTLDAFPLAERDASWRLLRARALTLGERGQEALALLAEDRAGKAGLLESLGPALEWERAQAAAGAAVVRRGKTPLPSAQREGLQAAYRRHLWNVARNDVDRELAIRALRALYVELADAEPLEDALEALVRLRQLDPKDTTGTPMLWERGWREYRARNPSGAIGYWSRLLELYPESRNARAAHYWSARAHERLGDAARARAILRQVAAASVTDFYSKQARLRLGGQAVESEDPPAVEPWPTEPRLERARLLSDLGLDSLALSELDALAPARAGSPPPAEQALRALLLSRKGSHRESIRLAREVFPALGGPSQASAPADALAIFYPFPYEKTISAEAARQGLKTSLVLGIIHQESGFDPTAISRSGARGLMQVMPATGRELAKKLALPFSTAKLLEPEYSVRLGTTYFRQVLEMFDGNVELALAGYNSGPFGLQRKWRLVGDQRELDLFLEELTPEEPRIYFKRIVVLSDTYRQLYPRTG